MSDTPPTSIPLPELPAELIDTVVDFLHDDEESLANCSLVCREWLPATRYHIFNNLLLDRWNVEEFLALTTRPSATVAGYIDHLIIDQGRFRDADFFQSLFRRLPRFNLLRTLELRNVKWLHYVMNAPDNLVSAFGRINNLKLSRCTFDHPLHLKSVIAGFRSLKRLSLSHTRLLVELPYLEQDAAAIGYLQPPKLPDINTLELWEEDRPHTMNWFPFDDVSITSFSVYLGGFSVSSLNQYLKIIGPSLRHLTLDDSHIYSIGGVFHRISSLNLSFNTELRTLCFNHFSFQSSHDLSSVLPSVLATATSTHLEEINFACDMPEIDVMTALVNDERLTGAGSMWTALDHVLSTFSRLRIIRFSLGMSHSVSPSFVDHVRRGLSSCNKRGLLSFGAAQCGSLCEKLSSQSTAMSSRNGAVKGPLCLARLYEYAL